VAKARAKWEKDEVPVLKKQWLSERNGGEPAPDLSAGAPSGRFRAPTPDQIERMSTDDYRKHRDKILAALE
jgi:hypothetical protein